MMLMFCVDSDRVGKVYNRQSTTGCYFKLLGCSIIWVSNKIRFNFIDTSRICGIKIGDHWSMLLKENIARVLFIQFGKTYYNYIIHIKSENVLVDISTNPLSGIKCKKQNRLEIFNPFSISIIFVDFLVCWLYFCFW